MAAVKQIEQYFMTEEAKDVPIVFAIVGQSQAGAGQNARSRLHRARPLGPTKGIAAQRRGDHAARATAKIGARLRDAEFVMHALVAERPGHVRMELAPRSRRP